MGKLTPTDRKKIAFIFFFSCFMLPMKAQLSYGVTGGLHMPTADMQQDGVVLFGSNYLNKGVMPPSGWGWYNTYNYYLNITFFPCLEVAYTCTLMGFKDFQKHGKRFNNQDRFFSARLRLLKEKQLWKYMPAIVVGCNDPASMSFGNWEKPALVDGTSNGYFNRYYVAMSKHIRYKKMGEIGLHISYLYGQRYDNKYNGIAIGANFRPFWEDKLNLIIEYDSRNFNCGFQYDLLKYFICTVELQDFKYASVGLACRIHLKKNK